MWLVGDDDPGASPDVMAVDLLCNVGLTVEEVSKRLAYTDTSTFCHAFKRWHGMPASGYLRETAALRAANPRLVASAAAGTTSAKLT